MAEKPPDSTKDPEFQRVLRNLLNMPHKPHKAESRSVKRKPQTDSRRDAPKPKPVVKPAKKKGG